MTLHRPSPEEFDAASPEELAAYARPALERLKRGRLPADVFMPIRALARFSTLDVVGFQAGTHGERVLIGQRGAEPGDRWWAGMQNIPGSVILPTEELEPMDLRMANGRPVELQGARVSQDITKPADRILATEFRGSIRRTAHVRELMRYWVDAGDIAENKINTFTEVELAHGHDEVISGAFYNTEDVIDNPPENLVVGHAYFIERSLTAFKAEQQA